MGFSELRIQTYLLVLVTGNGKYADFPDTSVSGPDRLRTSSSLLPRGAGGGLAKREKNFLLLEIYDLIRESGIRHLAGPGCLFSSADNTTIKWL